LNYNNKLQNLKELKKVLPQTSAPLTRGTETWLNVVEAYSQCDQLLRERLAQINVPIAQHDVFMALLRKPGATQQQLARGCFVAKSGVSMLLNKMKASGYVRREADKTDSRIKRTYLTEKGQNKAAKTLKIQQEIIETMADPLSDSELEMIGRTMKLVTASLRAVTNTKP
jgi:DNA-binding MarR family transcriptional regulator